MISEISRRLDAVIERQVEIGGHLDCLVARDQGGDRNDTAVPERETRALPYVAKSAVLLYFSSAGATIRTSSRVNIGFELGAAFVCSV